MRLVDNDALDLRHVQVAAQDVVADDLGREEEHALALPESLASFGLHGAGHLGHVVLGDADDAVAGVELLVDEGLGGRHEDDLAERVPAVEVEHDDGGDEGLAEAGGQDDHGVLVEAVLDDVELVGAGRHVARVDPD